MQPKRDFMAGIIRIKSQWKCIQFKLLPIYTNLKNTLKCDILGVFLKKFYLFGWFTLSNLQNIFADVRQSEHSPPLVLIRNKV